MSSRKPISAFLCFARRVWRLWRGYGAYLVLATGLLWAFAVLCCMGAAQPTGPGLDTLIDWATFLTWLSTPSGVTTAAGALLSIFFEYIPGYGQLTAKLKRVIFAAVCVFVPVAGAGLGCATLAWPVGWVATFWPAIVTGLYVFAVGTLAHTPKLGSAPEPSPDGEG